MRIFSSFAYFSTIIYEIIGDLKVFMVMLLILMFAFTNFFYVIDSHENLIERYWESSEGSNSILNSLLSTYLIGLGEFSFDGYEKATDGPARALCWLFFILATFVMLIVFMNLLIQIIGNKLDDIMMIQKQSIVKEQTDILLQFKSHTDIN